MSLQPLFSWDTWIRMDSGSISTLYRDDQETFSKTYNVSLSFDTLFAHSTTTIHTVNSPSDFNNDRSEFFEWTVTDRGYYRIESWADEDVDHFFYINGKQFYHNSAGERNTAYFHVYLNENDVVRVQQNNNNDYSSYEFTFKRYVVEDSWPTLNDSVKTPNVDGSI